MNNQEETSRGGCATSRGGEEVASPTLVHVSPVTVDNLEEHMTRLSCLIDPCLMLRLMLHKLSWDLNLVVKPKVAAQRTESDRSAIVSTCKSVGKSKSFERLVILLSLLLPTFAVFTDFA